RTGLRHEKRHEPGYAWPLFLEVAPAASVALHQIVGILRSPSSGSVVGEMARRERFPDIQYGVNHRPSSLDHISTLEERRVSDHAIVQQPLITGTGSDAEVVGVLEVHVDATQAHYGAGRLGSKA